jgi:hypothetical protein
MVNTSTKSRGIFLTILYVYSVLLAIMLFYSGIIYPPIIMGMGSTAGKLTLLVSALEIIPLAVALYGIWRWRRWGIYSLSVYIAIAILATFVSDVVFKIYVGYAQYVISFDLLTAVLWFWALSRKWSYFK